MTFKDYVKNVNKFLKDHPESASCQVIYSADDEGNRFQPVLYTPSIGTYEDMEFNGNTDNNVYPNAVCIN